MKNKNMPELFYTTEPSHIPEFSYKEHKAAFTAAEDYAASALRKMGHIIISRNYLCPGSGELDIVSLKDGCLYACEVKARKEQAVESPEAAFDKNKYLKTRRTFRLFMQQQLQAERPCALLACAVYWDRSQKIRGCRFYEW